MAIEHKIAKVFQLEGDSWLRHANPWSIGSRFATLPFLILAVWSRVWIGWYSLIPIVLLIIWLLINPTLFKKPKRFDGWAAKAVLGERFWTERSKRPIPKHHIAVVYILTVFQVIGTITLFIGLYYLEIYHTIAGAFLIYTFKIWFLDRMVWIYQDMSEVLEE